MSVITTNKKMYKVYYEVNQNVKIDLTSSSLNLSRFKKKCKEEGYEVIKIVDITEDFINSLDYKIVETSVTVTSSKYNGECVAEFFIGVKL